jgi:hypothetical protein
MKLTTLLVFGTGYVLGTKAGREQYERFLKLAHRASERLDAYGSGGSWADRLESYASGRSWHAGDEAGGGDPATR